MVTGVLTCITHGSIPPSRACTWSIHMVAGCLVLALTRGRAGCSKHSGTTLCRDKKKGMTTPELPRPNTTIAWRGHNQAEYSEQRMSISYRGISNSQSQLSSAIPCSNNTHQKCLLSYLDHSLNRGTLVHSSMFRWQSHKLHHSGSCKPYHSLVHRNQQHIL